MKYIRRPIPRLEKITHFGVSIHKTPFNKITRENYAICDKKVHVCWDETLPATKFKPSDVWDEGVFEDEEKTRYTDEYCAYHQEKCLKNFDMNMNYFEELDQQEFEEQLENLQRLSTRIVPVENLWDFENKSGYYVLVLDQYKQVYIDCSPNIRLRIIRHWAKKQEFDKLLVGNVEDSRLSINSFGALDTTRIFACKASLKNRQRILKYMHESINDKFILNKLGEKKR